jgi:hypothetical protein
MCLTDFTTAANWWPVGVTIPYLSVESRVPRPLGERAYTGSGHGCRSHHGRLQRPACAPALPHLLAPVQGAAPCPTSFQRARVHAGADRIHSYLVK